ncbi:MAG: hypothetical protein ACI9CA_001256 [Natronomonas sp.]|jgi:hypothetical protein
MSTVPESFHDLFEKPTIANVVTMLPDGRPHNTPVWVDYDAEDPRVAASMVDPEDPYRSLSVTGEVEETTTEGAREHIDELARRCMSQEYPNPVESERVVLRVRADAVYNQALG